METTSIVGESIMEEEKEKLREAAENGNVEFLRQCVAAHKPNHFYLTLFPERNLEDVLYGNILHIAAEAGQEEWIRVIIEEELLLPVEVIQQLLCQPCHDMSNYNPLHVAVTRGNVKIVKMFLKAFPINKQQEEEEEKKKMKMNDDGSSFVRPASSSNHHHHHHDDVPNNSNYPPPWLMTDNNGRTPCHWALVYGNEEVGLEILRMDKESLSNMVDDVGRSLLGIALDAGLDKVAMEILISSPRCSFSTSYICGINALHLVPKCTSSSEQGKAICKLLLKKFPDLIQQKADDGESVFHTWAEKGKIWPFECLLESNDIISNVRKVFLELISTTDKLGANPLHKLNPLHINLEGEDSSRKERAQIGKLFIDIYREEAKTLTLFDPAGELQYPWLVQDHNKRTPLDYAVEAGNEEFAHMILSEDKDVLKTCLKDVLVVAIEKSFHQVPLKILDIVDENEGLQYLLTNDQKLNALHLAPQCGRDFCEKLMKKHPELIEGVNKEGETILHKWVKIGQVWPFEYILNFIEINQRWAIPFLRLLKAYDKNNEYNPFHVAATCTNNESTLHIVKLLVQDFQLKLPWFTAAEDLPWYEKNKRDEGALHVAIRCQQDHQLALYLLSPSLLSYVKGGSMAGLLDYYEPKQHLILFLAMEKNFFEVVKIILTNLNKANCSKYLQDSSTGTNILHLASTCTDAEFARWLIGEVPSELITKQDKDGMSPLVKACEVGASKIVKLMLEKYPSEAFRKEPLAWVKACENGHVSVIQEFVNCCPEKFSDHCLDHQDTPLHHIKLPNLTRYEDFLKIQYMKDLINAQDSDEATPLHKAVQNRNILLAEVLLNMDKIRYNIKDVKEKTAKDLLAQVCKEDHRWNQMCENIGLDPNLRTSYFERKTDLLEVRNTLSVVAALLATITFTAGFTLPGGLNQETGEAMIVNKAIFVVFLLSDTLSMCFSMVVLISLIWSMTLERNQSLFLIDQSVGLLRLSLYLTLIAFVSGVYIVTSTKLLWAAILVIVICSLVAVSAKRQLLYKVLTLTDNLFSFVNHRCIDPINRMEQGLSQCLRGESSNQNTALHLHTS